MAKEIILESKNIPQHIACIMDGNGRWAKKRGLPRTYGHKVGVDRIKEIIIESKKLGVKVLTVFAFSTENWKRSEKEIDAIFSLLEDMLKREKNFFINENIKIKMIGTLNRLDGKYSSLKKEIEVTLEDTKNNNGLIFNIAFNYGSQDEMIRAIHSLIRDVQNNKLLIGDISKEVFEKYLMTSGLDDVDLMIRTSGEYRLSNFLLWQLAYSELCFVDTYWPDFDKVKFRQCIYDYQRRERRFGDAK